MYYVIGKLDAPKLAKMEFIINFGVTPEYKNIMTDIMEYGGDYEDVSKRFY